MKICVPSVYQRFAAANSLLLIRINKVEILIIINKSVNNINMFKKKFIAQTKKIFYYRPLGLRGGINLGLV